jgi:hypothetical protein
MQMLEIGPSVEGGDDHGEDGDQPFLEVEGVEGSTLRATFSGLLICRSSGSASSRVRAPRRWMYDQLRDVRLDAYGPIGVIRATIRESGADLPLLLLEPEQITAARRSLEVIWNRMSTVASSGSAS